MIASVLRKYNNKYHYLDARKTESFECEVIEFIEENELTFTDFKRVVKFLRENDLDDSSIGLFVLLDALNIALKKILVKDLDKKWEWLRDECIKVDDMFLEVIMNTDLDPSYQQEIGELLELDREYYYHFKEYYIALYLRNTHSNNYETYLDEHINSIDIKKLKMQLLIEQNEISKAFELIKDDRSFVLDAADLLEGENKEKYLVEKILDYPDESWWHYLQEIAGNKYLDVFMTSNNCCDLVNDELYQLKRYEELMNRINSNMCRDQYHAVTKYKKLKKLYPESCAMIMIEYGEYYMVRGSGRKYYHMSANTIARAGKLSEKSYILAKEAAQRLAEAYPNRYAMIEELKYAGLL